MDRGEGAKAVFTMLALTAALVVGFSEWGERVGSTIANPIGGWAYEFGGYDEFSQRLYKEDVSLNQQILGESGVSGVGLNESEIGGGEMDDALGFVLYVLFGILGVFILVRILKAASRSVDREQEAKRQPAQVRLGMTPGEVESALGQPETKADLGEKLIYRYKGLTVEFTGAKVSDVR